MIKEAYVSFEVAKLLKEKGFNEKCSRWYVANEPQEGMVESGFGENQFYINAPTHQMAMAWLREEHYIIFVFKPASFSGDKCTFWTYELWCGDNFEGEILSFKTYEQAVEAACLYTLEKLI